MNKRILLTLPIALLVTIGLFGFMTWLVTLGKTPLPDNSTITAFNIYQQTQESQTQRRHRELPKPPEKPNEPTQSKVVNVNQQSKALNQSAALMPLSMPSISIDSSITGLAISDPGSIKIAQNQQVMPLYRIEPRYPTRALKQRMEGFVLMTFTINKLGAPIDIKVVDSEPKRIFDREALRALKRWKYQPYIVDGVPTPRVGQSVKLEFKIQ